MKIIIAGAGEVGFHLAKLLSFESQDITLIDLNKDALAYAESHLDIRTIKGNATSISILKKADVSNADLIIAVTGLETANITICVLANELGVKQSIANISNTEFIDNEDEIGFKKFGIDELISPEALAADEISLLLSQSAFDDTYEFEKGALMMFGAYLTEDAPFVGKTVQEAAKQYTQLQFIPIAIQRKGTHVTTIPRGSTKFLEGDHAYFITLKSGVDELCKLIGKQKNTIKNVMLLGGGRIGHKTAQSLCEDRFKVKLIENDAKKAFNLADDLSKALIIKADGRNLEVLQEENLTDMDAFVAVTGNSETNIMSCIMAKSKGVDKTIALVENMDYINISQTIGIDTLINKKLIAASNIFRHIRKGEILASANLHNIDAEVFEFEVQKGAKVTQKTIKALRFPREAVFGGVIRNGEALMNLGNIQIQEGDHVIVFCLPEAISTVEELFY